MSPLVLEGQHVRLEPLRAEHVDPLCEVGLNEELWRWTVSPVRTREEMREFVGATLAEAGAGNGLAFATVDRASGSVAGSTRFANADRVHRRVEIGWTWLGRRWQRTALNTEAKYLMLRHAFERLGCLRVEFKTDVLNDASRRALLRIGAREEGTLRAHMVTADGRLRDSVYYSVLGSEWPRVRAALEARLAGGGRTDGGDSRAGSGRSGRRALPGGLELDDDPARVDVAAVHGFLSTSYWAAGRSRETIERLVRGASRVVGLYYGSRQVGFARTVSDGAAFAYLADVYVLPELRGRGLGLELVREAVERGPFAARRWLLHTADAHALYARVGFGRPSERLMERPAPSAAGEGGGSADDPGPTAEPT